MIKDIQFQLGLSERMSGDITAGGAMGFDILRLGTKGAKKGQGFIDPLGLSIEAKEAMQKAKEAQDVFLKQSVKTATDQLQLMQQVGKSVGDSIYDAFMHGKQGVDEFIKSLLIAIGRVLFLNWLEGGITSLFTPMPTVGSTPSLMPSIPRPSMQSSTQSVTSRLDAMNLNMMNNQPIVLIEANVSGVEFTKKIVNPSQVKLAKSNTRTQRI